MWRLGPVFSQIKRCVRDAVGGHRGHTAVVARPELGAAVHRRGLHSPPGRSILRPPDVRLADARHHRRRVVQRMQQPPVQPRLDGGQGGEVRRCGER